jgi:hypothetical protein
MLKEEADILGRLLDAKGQPQRSIRCGLELVVKVVARPRSLFFRTRERKPSLLTMARSPVASS